MGAGLGSIRRKQDPIEIRECQRKPKYHADFRIEYFYHLGLSVIRTAYI